MTDRLFVAIDVFCGAGGMSLGLLNAGIPVICGVDTDEVAADTYEANLGVPVIRADVRTITGPQLASFVPKRARVVLAACAPCQPFSKVRKSGRTKDGQDLLLSVGRIVRSMRPEAVLLENVPAIDRGHSGGVLGKFADILTSCGYSYAFDTLDAKHFGVPQTRRRMVLLAIKGCGQSVELPRRRKGKIMTVRDAIADLPRLEAGGPAVRRRLHKAAGLSADNVARLQATPKDGGDCRSWSDELLPECRRDREGFYDVYGRMRWDTPAPTLTTRCISLSNGRFGHPDQDRAISLLEAAVLQTFPRNYRFGGNQAAIARQIGNAVPVKLATALARALLSQL